VLTLAINLLVYLSAGFAAPFIFRWAPTPQIGGHWAGFLFAASGLWAVVRARRTSALGSLATIFVFELVFWLWRFFDERPLRDISILGVNAGVLHGIMTGLYLFGALILAWASWPRRSST
jgi:hypothetical protein